MAKMTIKDERKNTLHSIRALECGEIFTFQEEYYIVIDDSNEYACVNLETGERRVFNYDDIVLLVNATLIIE